MAVYVDHLFSMPSKDPRAFRVGESRGHQWCHMWADTEEELHVMADKLKLKRSWFQAKPFLAHYDLTPGRREAAIRAGALEYNVAQWKRGIKHSAITQPLL